MVKAAQLAMLYQGPRIGIDPGLSGAIALVNERACLDVRKMPRQGDGIDGRRLLEIIDDLDATGAVPVYVERVGLVVNKRPDVKDDRDKLGAGLLKFYRSIGALDCVLGMQSRPVVHVAANSWKAKVGLLAKRRGQVPKDASRKVAQQILGRSAWPYVRSNTNAADACLVGWLGPQFDERVRDDLPADATTGDPF